MTAKHDMNNISASRPIGPYLWLFDASGEIINLNFHSVNQSINHPFYLSVIKNYQLVSLILHAYVTKKIIEKLKQI